MSAFISLMLLFIGIVCEEEMLVVASGLFAIAAEINVYVDKLKEKRKDES